MKGFTLVELLVTVSIVGILASLAVSNFNTYKRKVNDALALSQIRHAITAVEASRIEHDQTLSTSVNSILIDYDGTTTTSSTLTLDQLLPGFSHQLGVEISYLSSPTNFTILSRHCQPSLGEVDGYATGSYYRFQNSSLSIIVNDPETPADGSECP